MKIAFEGSMDRWLWEALTGEPPADSLPLGSRARHDALVRRRSGTPCIDAIKPKVLATAFAPHQLLGFWDHHKHKHDDPFKPGMSKKEREQGGYIFDISDDAHASLDPSPGAWRAWLAEIGGGKPEHLDQLFDREAAASSAAATQLAAELDVMYGRAPTPAKALAKANKRFAKAVKNEAPDTTALHVWDLDLEVTPDLSGFPNTRDLSIGYNHFTILNGLSAVPKVEKLSLECCTSLVAIGDEVGQLTELRELNLYNCNNLLTLPETLRGHAKLEVLKLFQCPAALDIEMLASFPNLKEVTLPRGFASEPGGSHRVQESSAAMAELGDRLRAMRPDMTVRQFEDDLRMYYWL